MATLPLRTTLHAGRRNGYRNSLEELLEVFAVEPSALLVGFPQLACLVDIDIASLLCGRLREVLAFSEAVDFGDEDPSLVGQVLRTKELELGCGLDLLGMHVVHLGIVAEIVRAAPPGDFQGFGTRLVEC